MKTTRSNRMAIGATALLITMSAGLPVALASQPDRDSRQIQSQRERAVRHFVSSSDLMDADLKSPTDETLGSVEDFIVDRGSGRLIYAIVASGDFLGIGGKEFALPYGQMAYVPASEHFRTSMSEEQVKRQSEFLPENWNDLQHTTWMEKMEGWVSDDDADSREEFRKAASSKDKKTIEGTVAEVNREDGDRGENTVIRVLGEDGSTHDVVLGPSWYVMGGEHRPMRGDAIELTVVECDGATHAMAAEMRGNTVTYRNDTGDARWSASQVDRPRYILLSDLLGRSIDMAGTTNGEVDRVLVEAQSGLIAFVGMDPNENFLGMGDGTRLVPWSVFSVGPDSMALDADPEAVERGLEWPDDVSIFNTGGTISNAYTAFGAREPEFRRRGGGEWEWDGRAPRQNERPGTEPQTDRGREGWGRESPFVRTFSAGEPVTLDGTVSEIATETLQEGAPEALVITLDTGEGSRRVILGPSWFAGRENLLLGEGDQVRIEGRSATWNGEPWVSAWTVTKGEDRWSLWNNSRPGWDE